MVLKATPEDIRSSGKKLVNNAESYLGSVKNLYEAVHNLQAKWQGADNQEFVKILDGYKPNIDALGQVIGNYGVFLQETANSLEKLQSEIAQQASAL